MKCLNNLTSDKNIPQLVSVHRKTERRLLSVFMALLEICPDIRSEFLKLCEFPSGATATYRSFMEVTYTGSKYNDARPDGLIGCKRGQTEWSAFIEAKADGNPIRGDQISNYLDLAAAADVDAVITFSNEFARIPTAPPYHVDGKKLRSRKIFHFAWADVRTLLEVWSRTLKLNSTEQLVVKHCLDFLWSEVSGVRTFDAMPEQWPAFVEAASTTLGFNANTKGFVEIVDGWQQERRDLCSKLTRFTGINVELRHKAGARANDEMRTKVDREDLADDYILSAEFRFPGDGLTLDVVADLRACRTTCALQVPLPNEKGAKACATWLARNLAGLDGTDYSIHFDWPGRRADVKLPLREFLAEPLVVAEGQKAPPKGVYLQLGSHGVRNFKSRKKFVSDLESVVMLLMRFASEKSWVQLAT